MTTTVDVIDLRDSESALGVEPSDGDPVVDPSRQDGTRRAHRRRMIVLVLLALVAAVVVDLVVGAATHAEHQRHLADEFAEPLAEPQVGDASFVLQIPAIGFNEVVVEGAAATQLRGGPGRRLDSTVPGETGNTVIQGHSVRFGGPFGDLAELKGGNSIYLQSRAGEVTAYKVTKVRTVGSGDVEHLEAGGPSRLTLVTSAAGPLDGRRVIVTAAVDELGAGGAEAEEASVDSAAVEEVEQGAAATDGDPEEPTYDVRGLGGALMVVVGAMLIVLGVLGASGLRREYRAGTVALVAGAPIALGVVLVLFNVSSVLPTTY